MHKTRVRGDEQAAFFNEISCFSQAELATSVVGLNGVYGINSFTMAASSLPPNKTIG